MDIVTVGALGAAMLLVFAPLIANGSIVYFIDVGSMLIVVFGSLAAVASTVNMSDLKGMGGVLKKAFFNKPEDPSFTINLLVDLGEKARREGILALERELKAIDSEFLRKAIQLAVDGNEVDVIREVMETEIEYIGDRHKTGRMFLERLATMAPAYGMVGTLIGLIQMLKNLDDPDALGPGMAVALVTTFYGALLANGFYTPIANKLQLRSKEELLIKQLVLTGILSIQAGDNPRALREKLETFIAPSLRQGGEQL